MMKFAMIGLVLTPNQEPCKLLHQREQGQSNNSGNQLFKQIEYSYLLHHIRAHHAHPIAEGQYIPEDCKQYAAKDVEHNVNRSCALAVLGSADSGSDSGDTAADIHSEDDKHNLIKRAHCAGHSHRLQNTDRSGHALNYCGEYRTYQDCQHGLIFKAYHEIGEPCFV